MEKPKNTTPTLPSETYTIEGNDYAIAAAAGLAATVVGAIIWFLVAKFLNLRVGYVALGIGFLVNIAVSKVLKGKKSPLIGIMSAAIAILGIILGTFLVWYFLTPEWTREALVEGFDFTTSEAAAIPDSEFRSSYNFIQFLKDDLFTFDSENNPIINWLFFFLAGSIAYRQGTTFSKSKA